MVERGLVGVARDLAGVVVGDVMTVDFATKGCGVDWG